MPRSRAASDVVPEIEVDDAFNTRAFDVSVVVPAEVILVVFAVKLVVVEMILVVDAEKLLTRD